MASIHSSTKATAPGLHIAGMVGTGPVPGAFRLLRARKIRVGLPQDRALGARELRTGGRSRVIETRSA